ncbi:MAG: SMP-30/gluconolactonase/LRE family protein [Acidimicrobiales bacterium]
MADLELITDQLQFPEGPIATSDGKVIVVEIRNGRLSEVDVASGSITTLAECGGGPNGAAVGPDSQIWVCNNGGFMWHEIEGMVAPGPQPEDYIGGRIQRVDRNRGTVTDVYDRCGEHHLKGPNDIVFDREGGFWFTDLGKTRARDSDHGGLYYAAADGSRIDEVVYPLTQPNGVGLSPAADRVYVTETGPGRVWQWDIEAPGHVAAKDRGPGGATLLWGFDGYQLLDSLAVDSEGNVCVATLVTGAISVISPSGQLVEQVAVPEYDVFVTNICFGGEDLRTAYITSSGLGRLYATTWPCPGLPLAHVL